jgi:hypothetical protein
MIRNGGNCAEPEQTTRMYHSFEEANMTGLTAGWDQVLRVVEPC